MRWLLLLVAACGETPPTGPRHVGGCDGLETDIASEPGAHVAVGTQIAWSSNPPATGAHYPVWTQYDRTYTALDRGYWMHNAEHGAVILLYNCPAGCPEIVDGLVAVVKGMAIDHSCVSPLRQRALVAADPLLPSDVTVAAVAWDVTYTATCVDPYLSTFAIDHYNHAPEDLCGDGIDLGGTFIAP